MTVTWDDIAFRMEPFLAAEVAGAWSWLVPEPWTPVICSIVGGLFLEKTDGAVHWLDTGTGLIEQVASDRLRFEETLRTSRGLVDEWFLPPLIERLHAAGKVAGPGECYGFTILPIFKEGGYEADNMFVVPVAEQFVGTAEIHRQLVDVPDGAAVQMKVVD